MFQKAIGCAIFQLCIGLLLCLGNGSVHAQLQNAEDFEQRYATEVSKARAECSRLWSNHDFDPLRTRIPLGDEKPTFLMLKNAEKLRRKEKPLADLAIKTLEQCRKAYEPVYAMLPPQVRGMLEGIQRRQDSKVAELYNGKITFGDFNVAMNGMNAEVSAAFSGLSNSPKADEVASSSASSSRSTQSPISSNDKPAAPIESRTALVIGNSNYINLPKLSNPANDARAVADTLKSMGYKARLLIDGSEQNIRREIRQFASDSEKADVALVFYAGHGAQINGNNYLLPTDIDIPRTEVDIQFSGLKVDDLVNSIRSNTKIVFLDACRDNPALFKNLVKGRGSSPAGLAPAASSNFEQKPGGGIFIAYATDAGAVADDGSGKHSPFTQALLRNIQKPISIDDMFSLVTKEVRLVTRNAQRPYKYASLENIVCVAPNCSSSSNSASDTIVEQVQRSETDELQVAIESKKVAALETFLEKYPDTPKLSEVKNIIGSLKRSDFTEWTLYAIGNKRIPWYVQLSSIQRLQDRAAIRVRYSVDPTSNKVFFGRPLPDAEYIEDVNAYSCEKPAVATSEQTIFDKAMITLYHYKIGDPRYLNLSVGLTLSAGSVGDAIRVLACNEGIGTPSVGKDRLSLMNFRSLSSTVAGDGDLFFEPLRDLDDNSNEKNLLFVFRYNDERKIPLPIEPAAIANLVDLNNLPSYRIQLDNVRLLCAEKKLVSTKSEFYDASNKLVYMTARDPKVTITDWIEIKDATQSPLATLHSIFCNPGEATK
jgi:uncharacterized caspase-like protein